eukprot:9356704-Pyramimonas_sp.AAC.2
MATDPLGTGLRRRGCILGRLKGIVGRQRPLEGVVGMTRGRLWPPQWLSGDSQKRRWDSRRRAEPPGGPPICGLGSCPRAPQVPGP